MDVEIVDDPQRLAIQIRFDDERGIVTIGLKTEAEFDCLWEALSNYDYAHFEGGHDQLAAEGEK